LTAPATPLVSGRRLAEKAGWGKGRGGHRWRSRWSRSERAAYDATGAAGRGRRAPGQWAFPGVLSRERKKGLARLSSLSL